MLKAAADRTPKGRRDPARTRETLLQAAFEEMHKSGFRGADLETILRKSGVTKGAMYHHFANKESLGYAVLDEVIGRMTREKWQQPLAAAADPIATLVDIVRTTSRRGDQLSLGCPLNNLSQEMSPLDEGFRKRTARLFDEWHRAIADSLRTAKARGLLKKDVDPDETATFLIATYEGYLSLGKCYRDAKEWRAGQAILVRFLESLRASGKAQ